ncbi:MAG: alanine racemase [Clostridiales bacterium]|nr:alanine racemase [Clostridiales bacterium]
MKCYVIEREKLKANIELVKKRAEGKAIYGVVKGNGYGLGLIQLARFLRDYGIDRFAVTEPSDAVKLRMAGFIDEEILIIRPVWDESEVEDIIEARAVATIGSYNDAVILSGVAEKHGEVVEAHLKIDTGMGRYGFLPSEFDKISSVYRFLARINVTGIYTHLPCAFSAQKKTQQQIDTLVETAKKLRDAGYNPGCVHAANSSCLFGKYNLKGTDAVRIGSAFTGRLSGKNNAGLQNVGYGRCEIAEIRWLPEDHTIGYGSTYVAKKAMRAAIIPFGYADGFAISRDRDIFRLRDKLRYILGDIRLLLRRKRLYVTLNGKRVTVLGHVGMVHTTIDITDISCKTGDEVIFDINPLYASSSLERIYE